MKKLIIIIIILLPTYLYADFIVPLDDDIYEYLQSMEILNYISSDYVIIPGYYNKIKENLREINENNQISNSYKRLNKKYYNTLVLPSTKGFKSDVLPLGKLSPKIITPSYKDSRRTLLFYQKDSLQLFTSFMLGIDYDYKTDNDKDRTYQYYGLEFGGNFQKNLGLYTRYRKGNYTGDEDFILEDPYIHRSGGMYRKVIVYSEFDYKNPIINLSLGYGNFEIGKNITSSIILNGITNPYGYFKYYKSIRRFHFIAFNSQLTPDSLTESVAYKTKSFSLQTLYYQGKKFLLGLGQAVIYGDKTIDLAYWTPLMVFKLIDFKNHNRDNEVVFAYSVYRPLKGLLHYFNFFMDDLKKSQLLTKDYLTNLALQTGIMYQFLKIPLRVSFECTAVGPVTYSHRESEKIYTNDNMYLGYNYGSNLLNFASQINYMNPYFSTTIQYENMQQGSYGSNPFECELDPAKFLKGNVSRTQRFIFNFKFSLNPHVSVKIQYKNITEKPRTTQYLFTGLEIQY